MTYPHHFEVASVKEAVALAEALQASDEYNIFRGQTVDWPLRPSFIRLGTSEREIARERILDFAAFVESTPELAAVHGKCFEVWGIAQHYGIPTALVDFTTKPLVAGWFASHGQPPENNHQSIIYMAHEEFVREQYQHVLPQLQTVRIAVENLWRLQAQSGLFLHLPFNDDPKLDEWLAEAFGSIRFPFLGPMVEIPEAEIYPPRKSRLEILLDRFFTQEKRKQAHAFIVEKLGGSSYTIPSGIVGKLAPAFVGNVAPPVHESWASARTAAWLRPSPEPFRSQDNPSQVLLEVPLRVVDDSKALEKHLAQAIQAFMTGQNNARAGFVNFHLRLAGSPVYLDDCMHPERGFRRTVRQDMEDCWDGMRLFPYSDEVVTNALAYLATIWFQVHGCGRGWDDTVEELLGHNILVEFGRSSDGQAAIAAISVSEFKAVLRGDLLDFLKPPFHDLRTKPDQLLHQVIEPERLFDFERFARLFGHRFVPFQFVLRKWSAISFSPMDLDRLGNR